MIVIIDASAAVKLVLDEQDSDVVRRVWDEPVGMLAPAIVVPEVAAAIAAAERDGRIGPADTAGAQRSWRSLVAEIELRTVDPTLAELARSLATERPLRGMDSLYLATAVEVGRHGPAGLLTFDARQREVVPDDVALLPARLDA